MRNVFFDRLNEVAKRDTRILLINPDTAGFHCERFIRELPTQYLNVGVAEQNSIGIAAGLALEGKLPFVFNILTFATLRCYEQVRLDLCSMDLPVTIVGVGAGFDYSVLGPSHQATEDIAVMRVLPGMTVLSCSDDTLAEAAVDFCVRQSGPKYLRLDRTGTPLVYQEGAQPDFERGFSLLRSGTTLCIVATGRMVVRALELADTLANHSIQAGVIDVFKIKPLQEELFCREVSPYPRIATLEEHFVTGGLGSVVLEALANQGQSRQVLRLAVPDRFCRVCGDRTYLQRVNQLDVASLVQRLMGFCRDHPSSLAP